MSATVLGYLIGVGVVGLFLLVRVAWWLYGAERANLRRLKKLSFSVVETESPLEDDEAVMRKRGAVSIGAQFSVSRKLLIPLVLFGVAFLAGIPFLTRIPATVVSMVVAGVTVLVGVAARPVVENAIAGLVISGSRLVNIGDTVTIGDDYGTVEDIKTTHTTIKLWDWRRLVVANSAMLGKDFINYSLFDTFVWAYVEFWVDYSADMSEVERIAVEAAKASEAYAGYEDPALWIMDTTADGVKCWLAAWADTPAEAWQLKHDVRRGLIVELGARGWAPRTSRLWLAPGSERPSAAAAGH